MTRPWLIPCFLTAALGFSALSAANAHAQCPEPGTPAVGTDVTRRAIATVLRPRLHVPPRGNLRVQPIGWLLRPGVGCDLLVLAVASGAEEKAFLAHTHVDARRWSVHWVSEDLSPKVNPPSERPVLAFSDAEAQMVGDFDHDGHVDVWIHGPVFQSSAGDPHANEEEQAHWRGSAMVSAETGTLLTSFVDWAYFNSESDEGADAKSIALSRGLEPLEADAAHPTGGFALVTQYWRCTGWWPTNEDQGARCTAAGNPTLAELPLGGDNPSRWSDVPESYDGLRVAVTEVVRPPHVPAWMRPPPGSGSTAQTTTTTP